jgi:8-oxo-dGTP pyrophosphatase MutT (NUDIX family)
MAKAPAPIAVAPWRPTKELSVMAWIEDGFGGVLMVRQARGRMNWALPGGKVKPEETLEASLRREVREETGYAVTSCELLDIYDRPEKMGVSILYRVVLHRTPKGRPRTEEISAFGFKKTLPRNSTPSARFFWRRRA